METAVNDPSNAVDSHYQTIDKDHGNAKPLKQRGKSHLIVDITTSLRFYAYNVCDNCLWLCIMVLTQISRSRFKQLKISLLIPHIYVLVCFVNFFRDFGVYLEINSFFSKDSVVKLMEFENLGDFRCCFKLIRIRS